MWLYPLRYSPERRDAATEEKRRNPLGQGHGGASGGVASPVTMRRGIAPCSRLAIRPAMTLRHPARFWDRFLVLLLALTLVANAADLSELEQAARSGDCGAMIELASKYYYGDGVPKNATRAYIWGSIYMNSVPDYTRGIAKITGWAQDQLSLDQLRDADAEIEKLTGEIDKVK
ncbi:MAG: SEL1-like repeat protein [Chthoniobacterales bacterium]|nr:SEL1-like repeat protein [Chthoniobacterales bacterium]